jgi:hypothetical protein
MEPGLKMKRSKRFTFTSSVRKHADDIGGGRILSSLLAAPLNQHSLLSTSICIILDLSTPGNTIDSLLFWLSAVKEHLERAIDD